VGYRLFCLCFGHCRSCRIARFVDCGPSRRRSQLGRLHDYRINPLVCVPYRVSATDNSAHRRSRVSATDDRRRTIRRSGHRFCQRHFRGFPAQPVHAWPPLRIILTQSISSGPCIWVMVEVSCRAPPQHGVGRRRAWQRTSGRTTSQRQCSSFFARGSQTRSEFVQVFPLR
jgi:hypothetical protein